jgi:hypothetical protein
MEFDLNRLRDVRTSADFVKMIDETCAEKLTADFWSISLPGDLATPAAQSPSMFAFFAALNVLDARVLFSDHPVRDLMDPSVKGTRSSLERHHLFPVAHLGRLGVKDPREYNQIANFSMVEWGDNARISDQSPGEYVPELKRRFDAATIERMYRWHALPMGWETMGFPEFLKQRRLLMAQTIREAFEALSGPSSRSEPTRPALETLIVAGENDVVEFKSTLRTNLHTGERDPRMEQVVLKTIAAFLNSNGGTLVIGVADDGSPIGLDRDSFPNEDKMALHLVALLKDRLGGEHAVSVHPRFDDYEGVRVLRVECARSRLPVFVKDGQAERFFVRYGPSTQELTGASAQAFIASRFS